LSAAPADHSEDAKQPRWQVFDGRRDSLAANRVQFYREIPAGPFHRLNRPSAKLMEGAIENWQRQGMMGGAKAHYDGIKSFSETDLCEDLKRIDVPTLAMHGDDEEIVPYKGTAPLSAKLVKRGALKVYPGFPHIMLTAKSRSAASLRCAR
jgi:non-heme chloroperoxidase